MSVSQADVVDYIKNLKLVEVQDLIKVLEDTLGVEASAPVAMVAGGPAAAAEEVEEKTEFDVILEGAGDKKIGVIKVVREIVSGLGLKEAKDLVDGAPKPLLEKVTKEAADDAKAKLEAAGASVTVK